jgi:hypothetical protein
MIALVSERREFRAVLSLQPFPVPGGVAVGGAFLWVNTTVFFFFINLFIFHFYIAVITCIFRKYYLLMAPAFVPSKFFLAGAYGFR